MPASPTPNGARGQTSGAFWLWLHSTTLSSVQVGGAVVRGAHQGDDAPGTSVFPEHQAHQLPHQPAAPGGQQLSAGLLHRAGRCDPARGQREADAGPL